MIQCLFVFLFFSVAEMVLIFGTLVHTPARGQLEVLTNTVLATDNDGRIIHMESNVAPIDIEKTVLQWKLNPEDLVRLKSTQFLLPGFVDTHIHAPQYPFTGTGTDVPLMQWLNKYTFPCERQCEDVEWAKKVYTSLVKRLLRNGTTTALYFASIHLEATKALADITLAQGQRAFVGKVCMDQYSPDDYMETTNASVSDTEAFIHYCSSKKSSILTPVITPRFIPTCSPALLRALGELAHKYSVPVQSHISESLDEIAFVQQLYPGKHDTEIFDEAGLLTSRTVMAHGVHLSPSDVARLVERQSAVAICPLSNAYFAHGIFPVREYVGKLELKAGLGTDVAGGYAPSMLTSIRQLVIASKHISVEKNNDPSVQVDWKEALYLATMGGAISLGLGNEVGMFASGRVLDAMLVDVAAPQSPIDILREETPESLLEKFINLGDDRNIASVWVAGRQVLPFE
ncbi:guanine deaminase [Radiomyces spectabilis]|uniref:guanine deaminase n=1 Tax=Radiomyces spectabilis TaxID=64574 RepID=UPI00221F23E3|nr:guanine deaminase [Radiomyces spectabilis]KAI8367503.1 guanine deaminase [Radiomyces spectabilis]